MNLPQKPYPNKLSIMQLLGKITCKCYMFDIISHVDRILNFAEPRLVLQELFARDGTSSIPISNPIPGLNPEDGSKH